MAGRESDLEADVRFFFPEPSEPEEVLVSTEPEPKDQPGEQQEAPPGRGGTYVKRGGKRFPA